MSERRNMKNNAFVHVTTIDFLERCVVLLCGSLDELDKVVGRPSRFCSAEHAKILKRGWKNLRSVFAAELSEATTLSGLTTKHPRQSDVYVWLPKWDSATLVHELYHAVGMMCESAGIKDEETGAYLIGYLFRDIAWIEHAETKGRKAK